MPKTPTISEDAAGREKRKQAIIGACEAVNADAEINVLIEEWQAVPAEAFE